MWIFQLSHFFTVLGGSLSRSQSTILGNFSNLCHGFWSVDCQAYQLSLYHRQVFRSFYIWYSWYRVSIWPSLTHQLLNFILLIWGKNCSNLQKKFKSLFYCRAMAVSISMMTGRIGSFAGSNITGLMIKDFCTYMWILPAILLFIGACLSFTIPNIGKREKHFK